MEDRQKIMNFAGAAIIALLFIGVLFSTGASRRNKKELLSERLTTEKLLSEKLLIEKELIKLQSDFTALKKKSDENARLLGETNTQIEESRSRINSLTNENRSLQANKKALAELQKLKAELDRESTQLKMDYERLSNQNNDLQNSLASLNSEKKSLNSILEKNKMYDTDNFLLTATRGKKDKVVSHASRAKKINVAFEVPASLTEKISFNIITPSGKVISADDKSMTWYVGSDSRNLTASLSPLTGEYEKSQQVVLNYATKERLKKGEYRIQIISNGVDIGNCRMMLK
jgi:peptidoglycan hydrolase CwlO-like protein